MLAEYHMEPKNARPICHFFIPYKYINLGYLVDKIICLILILLHISHVGCKETLHTKQGKRGKPAYT